MNLFHLSEILLIQEFLAHSQNFLFKMDNSFPDSDPVRFLHLSPKENGQIKHFTLSNDVQLNMLFFLSLISPKLK